MADELRIVLDTTGKIDVFARIVDGTSQVGSNIPLIEIGTTAVYSADAPALPSGIFTVKYEDGDGLLGSSDLQWTGTAEGSFLNFQVNVNVPSETTNAAAGIPVLLADVDGTNAQIDNVIRFLFDEKQTPILYLLKDWLDSINKILADVTDIIFMIKKNATDTDVNAIYSKVLADTEVTTDLTNSSVSVLISDYTGLIVGDRYFIVLGLKFPSDTQFREVPAVKKQIEFRQDVIRG